MRRTESWAEAGLLFDLIAQEGRNQHLGRAVRRKGKEERKPLEFDSHLSNSHNPALWN